MITDPNGTTYSTATAGTPFALAFSNGNTQITLNGVAGQALQVQGDWSVVLHVTNKDGGTADNVAAPDTFDVTANPATMPTVNNVGNALAATVDGSTYNYTYTTTPMTAGAGATFNTTDTKATVIDTGNGNLDVSSQFTLKFNGDSATSTAITGLSASSATVSTLKGPLNVTYTAVNNYQQSITSPSNTPDTIGTDKITVTDPAVLTPATVGTAYNYSFKQSANLTTGSTELSDASTVTFSDPNAGLSYVLVDTNANGVKDDVKITGTPIAGHQGTINLTLNLQTPDGLVSKTSNASVQVDASSTTTGYLYCPSSAQAKSRPATVNSTVYSAANRAGDVLGSVAFGKVSGYESGNIQLFNASISNGALTCSYGSVGDDTSLYKFVTTTTLPSNATGYGAGWSGNSCIVKSTENSTTADNSCQVTYTFTG